MRHHRFVAPLAFAFLFLWGAPPVQAQFYQGVLRGLSRLSAPNNPSGARFGQFAVTREPVMDGWRLDFNRSFGPDALGRPNRIDLGPLDMTINSGTVAMSGQVSQRFLPMMEFSSVTPTALDYSVRLNTGVQDFQIDNARVAWNNQWSMNALGFYDYAVSVSHRGQFEIEGMFLEDHGTLDFDIGPINLSGNIAGDLLAAVTEPLFAASGQDNPFTIFSARATKLIQLDGTRNELTDKAKSGKVLSQREFDELMEATVTAAALEGSLPDFSFLADEEFAPTLDAVDLDSTESALQGDLTGNALIPEPSTTMFLVLAGMFMVATRRRS